MLLRDRAFGEPITSTLGARSELLDKLQLCLHGCLAGLDSTLDEFVLRAPNSPHYSHRLVRRPGAQLHLRSGDCPVMATILASTLIPPVKRYDFHRSIFSRQHIRGEV